MPYRTTPKMAQRKEARRSRLLNEAMRVFGRVGYHAATVPMIVAAAESSTGAFYLYFRSKEDVFAAALDSLGERISAAIATNRSPMYRGSRPTITRAPSGFLPATYRAMPITALRTLATVNSSAMIARQPEVPNLMVVFMMVVLIMELLLVAFRAAMVS